MPIPTTVWLARPGLPEGQRGTLSIEDDTLTFVSDAGQRVPIRGREIERVRRQRGSPVLEVRYRREGEERVALFFFIEPPSLEDRSTTPSPLTMIGIRGMGRMPGMSRLRAANRRLKPVVEAWSKAVREVAARQEGSTAT